MDSLELTKSSIVMFNPQPQLAAACKEQAQTKFNTYQFKSKNFLIAQNVKNKMEKRLIILLLAIPLLVGCVQTPSENITLTNESSLTEIQEQESEKTDEKLQQEIQELKEQQKSSSFETAKRYTLTIGESITIDNKIIKLQTVARNKNITIKANTLTEIIKPLHSKNLNGIEITNLASSFAGKSAEISIKKSLSGKILAALNEKFTLADKQISITSIDSLGNIYVKVNGLTDTAAPSKATNLKGIQVKNIQPYYSQDKEYQKALITIQQSTKGDILLETNDKLLFNNKIIQLKNVATHGGIMIQVNNQIVSLSSGQMKDVQGILIRNTKGIYSQRTEARRAKISVTLPLTQDKNNETISY